MPLPSEWDRVKQSDGKVVYMDKRNNRNTFTEPKFGSSDKFRSRFDEPSARSYGQGRGRTKAERRRAKRDCSRLATENRKTVKEEPASNFSRLFDVPRNSKESSSEGYLAREASMKRQREDLYASPSADNIKPYIDSKSFFDKSAEFQRRDLNVDPLAKRIKHHFDPIPPNDKPKEFQRRDFNVEPLANRIKDHFDPKPSDGKAKEFHRGDFDVNPLVNRIKNHFDPKPSNDKAKEFQRGDFNVDPLANKIKDCFDPKPSNNKAKEFQREDFNFEPLANRIKDHFDTKPCNDKFGEFQKLRESIEASATEVEYPFTRTTKIPERQSFNQSIKESLDIYVEPLVSRIKDHFDPRPSHDKANEFQRGDFNVDPLANRIKDQFDPKPSNDKAEEFQRGDFNVDPLANRIKDCFDQKSSNNKAKEFQREDFNFEPLSNRIKDQFDPKPYNDKAKGFQRGDFNVDPLANRIKDQFDPKPSNNKAKEFQRDDFNFEPLANRIKDHFDPKPFNDKFGEFQKIRKSMEAPAEGRVEYPLTRTTQIPERETFNQSIKESLNFNVEPLANRIKDHFDPKPFNDKTREFQRKDFNIEPSANRIKDHFDQKPSAQTILDHTFEEFQRLRESIVASAEGTVEYPFTRTTQIPEKETLYMSIKESLELSRYPSQAVHEEPSNKQQKLERCFHKVAIIPFDYPKETLNKEEFRIRERIGEYIDEIPYGGVVVRILKTYTARGAVVMICEDNETVDWLHQIVPRLNLKLVDESYLNSFCKKVSVFLPFEVHSKGRNQTNVKDDKYIMKKFKRQNACVDLCLWEVVRRIPSKNGTTLHIYVDSGFVDVLKRNEWKLFFDNVAVEFSVLEQVKQY